MQFHLLTFTLLFGIATIPPMALALVQHEPMVPHECQEIGICEKTHNYPHDVVDRIIAKIKPKLELLKAEEMDKTETRRFELSGDMELCERRDAVIVPEAIKGKTDKWYFVLNNKNNPMQGYRVGICRKAGQSCTDNILQPYGGYSTTCVQKYAQRTAIAIDVQKEDVFHMPFRVPTCCSCIATHEVKK